MEIGNTRFATGPISFALHHRYLDGGAPHTQGKGGPGNANATQGICIQVVGDVKGKETEILRFDCFDIDAHYHYGPENKNERIFLDSTTSGNSLGWTIKQLKTKLPMMIQRAGYEELAGQLDATQVSKKMVEVEAAAWEMDSEQRNYTRHSRGEPVIQAGNIRFGLEMRTVGPDGGPAIHLMADVADNEIELIAFDCFRVNPHYHYGPRNHNERIFMDTTLVDDSLEWVLDQFKGGKLPSMIRRAGYDSIAEALDVELVAEKVREVETTIKTMSKADPR